MKDGLPFSLFKSNQPLTVYLLCLKLDFSTVKWKGKQGHCLLIWLTNLEVVEKKAKVTGKASENRERLVMNIRFTLREQ